MEFKVRELEPRWGTLHSHEYEVIVNGNLHHIRKSHMTEAYVVYTAADGLLKGSMPLDSIEDCFEYIARKEG